MSQVLLWRDDHLVNLSCEETLVTGGISSFCIVDSCVCVTSKENGTLHIGQIEGQNEKFSVTLFPSSIHAIDIACTADKKLIYVTRDGRVYSVSPTNLDSREEIVLEEEASLCIHGHSTPRKRVRVKSVSTSMEGILFVTQNGHLWASGNHPHLDVKSNDGVKRVNYFQGRFVAAVSCGLNFSVALVLRKVLNNIAITDTSSQNEDSEDVFVYDCSRCISESSTSLLSHHSMSDICPLGLPLCKTSLDHSTSSTTSRGNCDRKSIDGTTSPSTEDEVLHQCHTCTTHSDQSDVSSLKMTLEGDKSYTPERDAEAKDKGNESDADREKKNGIFLNTEVARQFLTRQLSWVSSYGNAGEEFLDEYTKGTKRIVRQNVSNVANLVYEGVRTVGDKVATLSRHVSGGSDSCTGNEDSFEELSLEAIPAASFLRFEDFLASSSAGTSDHEGDGGADKFDPSMLCEMGANLLGAELYSWGAFCHGQLGIGDCIKRERPSLITRLSGTGVRKVKCGMNHAIALTLDGRMFAWGANNCCQVDSQGNTSLSSPCQVLCGSVGTMNDRTWDIACGDKHSLMLTHGGGSADEQYMYGILCQRYSDVVSFTALNTHSLWEFAKNGTDASIVAMVRNADEHIQVYKKYLEAACNVLSVGGFSFMSNVVEIPPRISELFADRLPPIGPLKKGMKRNICEATFSCALLHPLTRLNVYKCILQSLMRCNHGLDNIGSEGLKKMQWAFNKWEALCEESEQRRREADFTRRFWENAGRLVDSIRTPMRRLVRESRAHPIQVANSGRFSSHWIVLFSDILVHVAGSVHTVHPLSTIWVESIPDEDNDQHQHGLILTMPEENLHLQTATLQEKAEWLQALQSTIRFCISKPHSQMGSSAARHASYIFTKGQLKDAKYTGRWLNGKMQGWGRLEWPDGKTYVGQFLNNQQHGYGRLDSLNGDQYQGQWRDGYQNGRGILKYEGGDVYDGFFKDGLPHGHGTRKEGHFTASVASLYIGEWANGVKQGYGVMDNIITGEKYLGCWSNNMKHGCGLIVTLDGIYYEGVFMQDTLTGHGVMVFEDGTHYEGEFKSAGCFNGKGTLTLNTGDRLEGSLQGMWNEGIKFAGMIFKNSCTSSSLPSTSEKAESKPNSFGKLCVSPNQKWKSIFRQCLTPLALPSSIIEAISSGSKAPDKSDIESNGPSPQLDLQRLWSSVAVAINTSLQESVAAARALNKVKSQESLHDLDTIPLWGRDTLDKISYKKVQHYLVKAFESSHHPLGILLTELTTAYTATYGGVRVHPLLLSHAVAELHSVVARVYEVVRLLFPALPQYGQEFLLSSSPAKYDNESDDLERQPEDGEVVSASALLHPFVLPRVHAALFVLYALHNKAEDDAYWKRLLKWNKQPDMTLLAFLGIDQQVKFWIHYSSEPSILCASKGPKPPFSPSREQLFTEAVETLQQLKTTFSPFEKLLVIRSTFEQLTQAVKREVGSEYLWTMDELFPVFHFVVVRSRILQLGSEIHFIEDFMERHLQNGELGIMFTTLKACYYQILQEKISLSS
ncbi:Alsin [Frankliniella fusca]|uniref:Alsin n=1 Tax=Frankliniella fusca TaxID=407009 RepID=A0AAE1H8R0_9NEOP|nr:Alsin [Frankliniella fusca]